MMRRGIGRPGRGLVGTMAATAVVAGTAGAVHHRQQQRWANQAAEQQADQQAQQQAYDQQAQMDQMQQQLAQMQAQQAQAAVAPAAAPAAAAAPDMMTQLNQLAQMKSAGILTEEEFQAAKAKLLG